MGSIPSLHRGRRKDAQMALSTGLTPSIGQVPYAPIPKQLSHEAHDTSGKGIPASLKVHPCQADGIPTSIPCKRTKDVLLQQDILAVQSAAAVSARKSVPVLLIPAMADDCNSHRVRRDTLFLQSPGRGQSPICQLLFRCCLNPHPILPSKLPTLKEKTTGVLSCIIRPDGPHLAGRMRKTCCLQRTTAFGEI